MYVLKATNIFVEKFQNYLNNKRKRIGFEGIKEFTQDETGLKDLEKIKSLLSKNKRNSYNLLNNLIDSPEFINNEALNNMLYARYSTILNTSITPVQRKISSPDINPNELNLETNLNRNSLTTSDLAESSLPNQNSLKPSLFKKTMTNDFTTINTLNKNLQAIRNNFIIDEKEEVSESKIESIEVDLQNEIEKINKGKEDLNNLSNNCSTGKNSIATNHKAAAKPSIVLNERPSKTLHESNFFNNVKSEPLRVGDILIIKYEYSYSELVKPYISVLCPSGIISKKILCDPISSLQQGNITTKRALFRLESIQTTNYQKIHDETKYLRDYNFLVKENEKMENNIDEFMKRELKYGESFHLVNIFTEELLAVDLNHVSKELGCYNIALKSIKDKTTIFKLRPKDYLKNEGDHILYSDSFFIMPDCLKDDEYLHVDTTQIKEDSVLEVNVSQGKSLFKMCLIDRRNTGDKLENVFISTNTIRLYSSDQMGYVTVKGREKNINKEKEIQTSSKSYINTQENLITDMNPENLNESFNSYKDDSKSLAEDNFQTKLVEKNKTTMFLSSKIAETNFFNCKNLLTENKNKMNHSDFYEVYIETDEDKLEESNTYWEILYHESYESKFLSYGMAIRLRHICTGLYLSYHLDSFDSIYLTKSALDSNTLFVIISNNTEENKNKSQITFNSQIVLKTFDSNLYFTFDKNNNSSKLLLGKEKNSLKIENVENSYINILYNMPFMREKLLKLYSLIYDWGLKIKEGNENETNTNISKEKLYDYELALETEFDLKRTLLLLEKILTMIINDGIKWKTKSELIFKKIQNFYYEQGILHQLVIIISMLNVKSNKELIIDGEISNEDHDDSIKNIKNSTIDPHELASKYSQTPIKMIIEILELFINKNCRVANIIKEEYINIESLYHRYNLEILNLIKNSISATVNSNLKNTNSTIIYPSNLNSENERKIDTENFGRVNDQYKSIEFWSRKLTPINLETDNFEVQTIILQILSMICSDKSDYSYLNDNKRSVKKMIFDKDITPIKFGTDGSRQFIRFHLWTGQSISQQQFLKINPFLSVLKRGSNLSEVDVNLRNNDALIDLDLDNLSEKKFFEANDSDPINVHNKFTKYICAVIEFYCSACADRENENLNILTDPKGIGLTFVHVREVLINLNKVLPMSIYNQYLKLLRVCFIDRDPYIRISKNKLKVYHWKKLSDKVDNLESFYEMYIDTYSNILKVEDRVKFKKSREDFNFILNNVVFKFWKGKEQIIHLNECYSNQSIKRDLDTNVVMNLLTYVQELFALTKDVIDLGLINLKSMDIILKGICHFLSVFSDMDLNYIPPEYNQLNSDDHWLREIASVCLNSDMAELKAPMFKLFESVLEIIIVISSIKENIQIYNFLSLFKDWYNQGNSLTDNNELISTCENIINKLKYKLYDNDEKKNFLGNRTNVTNNHAELEKKTINKTSILKKTKTSKQTKSILINHDHLENNKYFDDVDGEDKAEKLNIDPAINDVLSINNRNSKYKAQNSNENKNNFVNEDNTLYTHGFITVKTVNFNNNNTSKKIGNYTKKLVSFDLYLLSILLKEEDFSSNFLRAKSFKLLMHYNNQMENLKTDLSDVELVINDSDDNIFKNLCNTSLRLKRLKDSIKKEYSHYIKHKNSIKEVFLNKIQDIERIIENELVKILPIDPIMNLSKLQNICRHLRIHEIVLEIMNLLKEFPGNLSFYSVSFLFLYHFCYKNHTNQILLGSLIDSFIFQAIEYENVGLVLSEILNLYKDNPKEIILYINKLFEVKNENGSGILNIELVKALKSLTLSQNNEWIHFNKELIMKLIFKDKNLLKFYFTKEETDELKKINKVTLKKIYNDNESNDFKPNDNSKKQLPNYKNIMNSSNKISNKHLVKIKFQLSVIELISMCSKDNLFCVLNCRNLMEIDNILDVLYSCEIPYIMKPIYLNLFYNIFYNETIEENSEKYYPVHTIFDVLKFFILPELSIYLFHLPNIIESNKNSLNTDLMEYIMHKIKDSNLRTYLRDGKINLEALGKESYFNSRKFISRNGSREYWNFLYEDKENTKTGVLIFLKQIFQVIKKMKVKLTTEENKILSNIKFILNDMIDSILYIEDELDDNQEIKSLQYEIYGCLVNIPDKKYFKNLHRQFDTESEHKYPGNNNEIEQDNDLKSNLLNEKTYELNAYKVFKTIIDYIKNNNAKVSEVFSILFNNQNEHISVPEFKKNIKLVISQNLTEEEIDAAVGYVNATSKDNLSLKDFSLILLQFTKNNKLKAKQSENNMIKYELTSFLNIESIANKEDSSFIISKVFKSFVSSFDELQTQQLTETKNEPSQLVKKLMDYIENCSEDREELENKIIIFAEYVKHSFDELTKLEKIFILKLLQNMITHKKINNRLDFKEEKVIHISLKKTIIILCLNKAGITELAYGIIINKNPSELIEEGLNLINLLMKKQILRVKLSAYQFLTDPNTDNTYKFTWLIRDFFNLIISKIKEKFSLQNLETKQNLTVFSNLNIFNNNPINFEKNNERNSKIPIMILKMLKSMFGESVEKFRNENEQEYFLQFQNKIGSLNIFNKVFNLLNTLMSFGEVIYSDDETMKLIYKSYSTLEVIGVELWKENLKLLSSKIFLFRSFNNLLKEEFNFDLKDPINLQKNKFFCKSISFFNNIINFENIKEIGKIMIEELEIFMFIEKLIDIYDYKIKTNLNVLNAGKLCSLTTKLAKENNNLQKTKQSSSNYNCSNLICKEGYISSNDMKYIKTSYKLFIILIQLKENFPEKHKMKIFSLNFSDEGVFAKARMNMNNKTNLLTNQSHMTSKTDRTSYAKINNPLESSRNKNASTPNKKIKEILNKNINYSESSLDTSRYLLNKITTQYSTLSARRKHVLSNMLHKWCHMISCRFCPKNKLKNKVINRLYEGNETERGTIYKFDLKSETTRNKTDLTSHKSFSNTMVGLDTNFKQRIKEKYLNFNEVYTFFSRKISCVEIDFKGKLVKTYFKIPVIFKFMKEERILEITLIYGENHHEKIQEFIKKVNLLKIDLNQQQILNRYSWISNQWRVIRSFSLALAVFSNLVLIGFIEKENNSQTVSPVFGYKDPFATHIDAINVVSIIQIIINVLGLIMLIINQSEYMHSKLENKANEHFLACKQDRYSCSILFNRLAETKKNIEKIDILSSRIELMLEKVIKLLYRTKYMNLLLDSEVLLFLFYIFFSFLAIIYSRFFILILLLDATSKSSKLREISHAITSNWRYFFSIFTLMSIVLIYYSFIYFYKFSNLFNLLDTNSNLEVNRCSTIFECFAYILRNGLTSYDGSINMIEDISGSNSVYWLKYFIDLSFFFVFIIFFLNLIFATILDSYQAMRRVNDKKIKCINSCFICGMHRKYFDKKSKEAWRTHCQYEHNVLAYIYYLVDIDRKTMNECDEIGKYVKKNIAKENYSFLPTFKALSAHDLSSVKNY